MQRASALLRGAVPTPRHPIRALTHSNALVSSRIAPAVLVCSTRAFYDKVRQSRDGSDEGPEQMFADFAKSPHRQRVPAELHKGNKNAVEGADVLNRIFLVFLLFFFPAMVYYLNPFRLDPYERPEGYGLTASSNVSGQEGRV